MPAAIREAAENEAAEIWRPYGVVLGRSFPGCGVVADSLLVVPPIVATPDEVRHLARALHAALDEVLPGLESAAVPKE